MRSMAASGKMPNTERIMQALGKAIAARRSELGVTQVALSEAAQVDRAFLSGIERGARQPTISTLARIAYSLDTTAAAMLEDIA